MKIWHKIFGHPFNAETLEIMYNPSIPSYGAKWYCSCGEPCGVAYTIVDGEKVFLDAMGRPLK